jgi:hypothetical protein
MNAIGKSFWMPRQETILHSASKPAATKNYTSQALELAAGSCVLEASHAGALDCSKRLAGASWIPSPDHKWPMRPLSLHLPGRSMLGWRF